MFIPTLQGGLGNNLFQIASVYSFSKDYNQEFRLHDKYFHKCNHHTSNYKETIFKNLSKYWIDTKITINDVIKCKFNGTMDMNIDMNKNTKMKNILFEGYYQNELNFKNHKKEIINLFLPIGNTGSTGSTENTESTENDYFIHVRRGDYVNNRYHQLNLHNYYKDSLNYINSISSGLVCNVISDDINYCMDYELFADYRTNFIKNKDEIESLSIMANSKYGGISSNSTFSWWGLYFNTDRPYLIIPDKYFPHSLEDSSKYIFDNCIVKNV